MIATSLVTGMFSLIFLYLSYHMERLYMRFWGFALLGYTVIFIIDSIFLENHGFLHIYSDARMVISIVCSTLFLYGTSDFFLIRIPKKLLYGIEMTIGLLLISLFFKELYHILQIPVTILLSILLTSSGIIFMLFSWTPKMTEKYITGFVVILWSIYSCNIPYTFKYTSLAMVNYIIGLCVLIVMVVLLMILHFKIEKLKLFIQEKRYRMLVENATGAILLYSYIDKNFKYVSPAINTFLDYDSKNILNDPKTVYNEIDSEGRENMRKLFSKPITDNISFTFSKRTVKGNEKWYELHATPVYNASPNPTEVECVISDITVKMETINNLRLSEESRKELIEDISHELRTPITLIQGYSEIMLEDSVYELHKDYLEIIHSKSISMNLLLDDLIQGSNFRSQSVEYEFYEVNAKDFLTQTLRDYKWLIEDNKRQSRCRNIMREDCFVIIDNDRIMQVFNNIVDNAIKFTLAGDNIDIDCNIESTESQDEVQGKLVIRISDSGMGILENNPNDIFKRKYRGIIKDNYANSGSGLGLYISNEIVEEHGGEIWVENNLKKGTSFYFALPCYFK